ncbi:MAG: PilT/PilU family type 4a pilus ATPase [Lachnospiraceae bacterium]|nr:PilT/PilU family type 4a pilus ATPase [Lachnospiraceae bacterium]
MKIEEILQNAYDKKVSDIHMIADSPIMFRIHGKMVPQSEDICLVQEIEDMLKSVFTKEQWQELEEEGEFDSAVSLKGVGRIRINAYRQRGTYAAALRILSSQIPTPEELKLPKSILALTKKSKGLILITGEAGSGKSTTLASLMNYIAQNETKNIITIENPIEYLLSHGKGIVSQREIGTDTKCYANAVRSAMRQDPDVLFVGELTDTEIIEEVIKAAETGHLVFSSLCTNQTEDTLRRLIEVFPEHRRQQIRVQLSAVLRGVISQKLLPRCDMEGRSAVYEILYMDKNMQNLLREDKIPQMISALENQETEGMQTMDDAILSAYMKMQISADTAVTHAQNPESMRAKTRIY